MRIRLTLIIVLMLLAITCVKGYTIFYMKESGSCISNSVEINIGSVYRNSTGILKNSISSKFEPGLHCTLFLRPPLSYGLVTSIKSINLLPAVLNYEDCENYLEISPTESQTSVKLCGYSYDEYEFKSYSHWGGMRITFHTSNVSLQKRAEFRLTFTAVRRGNGFCFKEERHCDNHNCIWKGLTCDGHNNCGDLSDELDKEVSQCSTMSSGESLAVIIVSIVGSLILLFIAAYFRGPKITRQLERLREAEERRRCRSNPSCLHEANEINRTVPGVHRIRTNYGSTSQLISSSDHSDVMFRDPPPRYEDLPIAPNTFGTRPQTSPTIHRISRGVTLQVPAVIPETPVTQWRPPIGLQNVVQQAR